MKKILFMLMMPVVVGSCQNAADMSKAKNPTLKNANDSLSYSIGIDIGTKMQKQGLDSLDVNLLRAGILVGYAKDSTGKINAQQASDFLTKYFQEKQKEKMEQRAAAAQKNADSAKAWLAINGQKPGVKTTADGLEYTVVKGGGTGNSPRDFDTVIVNYTGKLVNGFVFDSSQKRGQPAKIPLNRVIKGWTEGIAMMKAGEQYTFFIPPELGYGPSGKGDLIPPNAALVFDIELVKVIPGKAPAAQGSQTAPKTGGH